MWYNLAATQDLKAAAELSARARDDIAKYMTPTQIAEAQRLAREWLEKHGGK
jgi:DNA replication initiation complex subunit (GINS family)